MAWALLVALAGLIYALLVHPLWIEPMMAAAERIDELSKREQRIQTQLGQAPQIDRGLRQAAEQLAARPGFMGEHSAELASAALVKRLEDAVRAADPDGVSCAINNRSPLPQEAESGRFLRISVRVHLRCGVPQLSAILHALESGRPRLFVRNLNLLAQRGEGGQLSSGGLEASFDVNGYIDPGRGTHASAETGHAP